MIRYLVMLGLLSSCAIVHHVKVGDIKRLPGHKRQPFEVLMSETGINLKEAADIIDSVGRTDQASEIEEIVSMFQMGPRTGNMVFNEKYADKIAQAIYKKCPSKKVTGLLTVRETNKYPVVSGEIVKIKGYCLVK